MLLEQLILKKSNYMLVTGGGRHALRAALAGDAKDAQGKQQVVPAADLAVWLEQPGGVE